jgi:hypothetical protein
MRAGVVWLSALSMLVQVPVLPPHGVAEPRQSIVDGWCTEVAIFRDRGTGAGEPLRPAPVPFSPGEQRRAVGLPAVPRERARCGWLRGQGPVASCEAGG